MTGPARKLATLADLDALPATWRGEIIDGELHAYPWYIDPEARVLTVSRLADGKWVELGVHAADAKVRAEPFDAIEVELGAQSAS